MKITLKSLALALLVLLVPALAFGQQNVLVQTTLSAAVNAPISGAANLVQIASATGITAPSLNSTATANIQNQWGLYVDREFMTVTGINGTTLSVIRGQSGTVATAHASGAMVLYGRLNWFYVTDPGATPTASGGISGAACTTASTFVAPYLNIRTGAQWLCSTITTTWVPGFNNAQTPGSSAVTTLVASAAGAILPSGPLFHVNGTAAVTGFTIPVGCNATAVGGCSFTIIPDAAFTWTTAGNIATTGTAVANLAITFRWDATNSKWIAQQSK
jgi:hypothetical protein